MKELFLLQYQGGFGKGNELEGSVHLCFLKGKLYISVLIIVVQVCTPIMHRQEINQLQVLIRLPVLREMYKHNRYLEQLTDRGIHHNNQYKKRDKRLFHAVNIRYSIEYKRKTDGFEGANACLSSILNCC